MKIYIDRLRDDKEQEINEKVSPDFLGIQEDELKFLQPVIFKGKAYLTNDHLVIQLTVKTEAQIPCLICNDLTSFPIEIKDEYHTVPFDTLKDTVYDFENWLRELILLEVPSFIECHNGKCPARNELRQFLKKDEAIYFPFDHL